MKYELSKNAGFCFGVKRAMNIAWEKINESEGEKIYSLGPLIHNKQAVMKYEQKGLVVIDDITEAKNSNKMIIRSHGVSKKVYDDADKLGIEIFDTTCPFVLKIHNIVKRAKDLGQEVIILGDKNHPEIKGINGWADNEGIIIKSVEELKKIKLDQNKTYSLVAQTTMNEKVYEEIVGILKSELNDVNIYNTICSATKERQQSARELAKKVDVMVVIGGKHSSNTQKLKSICSEYCPTFQIEVVDELKNVDLLKYEMVGITAGASTPDWIIEEVISYIGSL